MAYTFTKFDPRAFIERQELRLAPAKAANPAKVSATQVPALAALATLAACHPAFENPGAAYEAELVAPAPWFERVAPPVEGEPGFEMSCAARRGRVEEWDGVLLHFCAECGAWGSFGYGVDLRGGRLGRWYCADHRPCADGPLTSSEAR